MTGWSEVVASQTTTPSGALSTTTRQASSDQLFILSSPSSSRIQLQCRRRRAPFEPFLSALPLRPIPEVLRAYATASVEPHEAQARSRLGLHRQVIQQLLH